MNRGNRNGTSTSNSATTSTTSCDNAMAPAIKYMTQMQKIVSNFDRQTKRAKRHSDLMYKKNGKTSKFTNISALLVTVGGGSKTNMSCGGVTGNTGATKLKTLMTTLADCPKTVNASCGNHTWVALNTTLVSSCTTLIKDFTAAVEKSQDGGDCKGWADTKLAQMSNKLADCGKDNIKDPQAKITKQKDACTKAFQTCKTAEDDSVFAVAACMKSSSALITQAAKLKSNFDASLAALDKVKSLAKAARNKRAATTCAEVVTKTNTLITLINKSPSDPMISTVSVQISSSSVTCSATEKAELSTAATFLETAVDTIGTALEGVLSELEDQTGSTPSFAALTTAKATTAKATTTTTTAKATTTTAKATTTTTAKKTTTTAKATTTTTAKKTTTSTTTST